jgi:8-oxo-dGTP pyrophosphatase MutT (NUDIX family)
MPRLAATVILMRPTSTGFEVFAMRRAASMAFAPGMYAFPGGSVDPSDSDLFIDWVGPDPDEWADRMALPPGPAQAVVCAAVRELYEEAGVLLADVSRGQLASNLEGDRWEAARADLLARRHSLTEWFGAAGLALRADLLSPWARWLTPAFEPRRFDTFFFLAQLPAEQQARDLGGEADETVWVGPADALALPMLPPTRHTLGELARHRDIEAVLAAAADRDITTPVQPVIEVEPDGAWLRLA